MNNLVNSLEQLQQWMESNEDEHLEFKEAKDHFDFEKLVKYCAALANEGGGKLILGITDNKPRRVVGTKAFADPKRTSSGLTERLRIRIDPELICHPNGTVLVFHIPSRPIGYPIPCKGAYWMRSGQNLVPMTPDMLKRIFDEAGPDFTAEICPRATIADLDSNAIDIFRQKWYRKAKNDAILQCSDIQLLTDAEMIVDEQLTYAALILFGTSQALGKYLAQAEVVYEYRSTDSSIQYAKRLEYRKGFFLFYNNLWEAIDVRNDIQQYQDGLFRYDIPTFNEEVVREAILNAVSHRDYRLQGSVFIRQFPHKLELINPGGFPAGINAENIIRKQSPRNRRIAEAFARCGLVERSGQGADLIFDRSIREGKSIPDFTNTDDYQVYLTLRCEIEDPRFLQFLEKIGKEQLESFAINDFLALDCINHEKRIPDYLKPNVRHLIDLGIVDSTGRGRGAKYILSRRMYGFLDKKGVYTRKRGLNRETNKQLLLKHIHDNWPNGAPLKELKQVLPSLSDSQIKYFMRELRADGKASCVGWGRGAKWYWNETNIEKKGES